jgi:predicted ester cyclase
MLPGAQGVKQLITGYRAAFPDLHLTNEDLIAKGDWVVNRWSMTGTHKGEKISVCQNQLCQIQVRQFTLW